MSDKYLYVMLFGLFIAVVSGFLLLLKIRRKKVCTAQVQGIVTASILRLSRGKNKKIFDYHATYKYSVDGVEYVDSVKRKYAEGQRVIVYYDPSNPKRNYPDKLGIFQIIFFIAIGAFIAILPWLPGWIR